MAGGPVAHGVDGARAAAALGIDLARTVSSEGEAPGPSGSAEEAVGLLDGFEEDAGGAGAELDLELTRALAKPGQDSLDVIVHLRDQADLEELAQRAAAVGLAAEVESTATSVSEARQAGKVARTATVVAGLQEVAGGAAQGRVREILERGDAEDIETFWIVNALSATVSPDVVETLARHPEVSRIDLDTTFSLPETQSEPNLPTWGHEKINAPKTWAEYGHRGEGVVVAVVDSGVDGAHPALAGSYRGADGDHADSWYAPTGENYPTPGDGNGHGTHVTGTISGDAPGQRVGVAPDAEWIGVKIFDDRGGTSDSIILDGAQWVLAPGGDPAKAPDVVNNSWGHPDSTRTAFWDSVAAWSAAGIFPVFANGNHGPGSGTVGSPGSFPMSFGVGATDVNDRIASFSSRGPAVWDGVEVIKPDVSAPGHQILSTWPRQLGDGTGYNTISGTSMAAPHVSGAVALLLSAQPALTVEQIWQTLEDTARVEPHMGEVPNNTYGRGIIDTYAATTTIAHSGRLTGTVTGPDGPVAARVSVDGGDFTVTSDQDSGAYAVTVPAGGAEVQVSAHGYLTQTFTVDLEVDERSQRDVQLQVAPAASVTGTVTADGIPARGAVVSLSPGDVEGPAVQAVTDADGGYSASVPHGEYAVRAELAGYLPATTELEVTGETTLDLDLAALSTPAEPGWSQFQNGPGRIGLTSEGITVSALDVAWSTDLEGDVSFSSPVVHDGRLFLATTWSGGGALSAVDTETGELLWVHRSAANQRTTPAVTDDAVYLSDGDNNALIALDPTTGQRLWTYPTGEERTVYGSPVVDDGLVYLSTGLGVDNGGFVHAVDTATGERVWRSEVGPQGLMGPAVSAGVVVAVSNQTGAIRAFDAATGEQVWEHVHAHGILASPSIAEGTVYVGTSGGAGGSLLALDLATGDLLWEVADHGSVQNGAPAVYDDLVIAGSHGRGWVRGYDRETGQLRWTHETRYAVTSPQGVSGDGIVLGGSQSGVVWALDAATGDQLWEHELPRATLSAPALAGGTAYFASTNGVVTAIASSGTVAGTVSGPDGGVAAYLEVVETGQGVAADADGSFTLSHRPGEWTVRASAYGYAPVEAEVLIVGGQTVGLDLTVTPVDDGSLSGTVTSAEGPVAGATVTVSGPGGDPVVEPGSTDTEGVYAFTTMAAGEYDVLVQADGFAPFTGAVTVTAGEETVLDVSLEPFQVAVAADHEGQVAEVLRERGWLVEDVAFADLPGAVANYSVVVLAGSTDDPADAAILAPLVQEAQEAGVSLVALDQRRLVGGSVRALLEVTDAGTFVEESHWRGTTWAQDVSPHPITAALADEGRTELLTSVDAAWVEDLDGHALARGGTYASGPVGTVVGLVAQDHDSAHVLLPLHAATPDSGPDRTWLPVMADLLDDAVTWAVDAEFGEVAGTVIGPDGAAVPAVVETLDGPSAASDEDGYALLLEPGEHTLRISQPGWQTQEQTVTVVAGESLDLDWVLIPAASGTLGGQVTDQAGTPVIGAQVVIDELDLSATVGEEGSYLITDVPSGTWTVTASAPEHIPTTVPDVVVEAGEAATLDVVLGTAPSVAVLGDRDGLLTAFLNDRGIPAQEAGWDVTEDLTDVDVAILALPTVPTEKTFLAALDAFEEAGVSVIGSAGINSSSLRGGYLFSQHLGDPEQVVGVGGGGQNIHVTHATPHPALRGLPEDVPWQVSFAGEAAAFIGGSGVPIATFTADDQDPRGPAAVYYPRANGTVHLLVGGLGATFRITPEETWTDEGKEFYLNLIRWADQPAMGEVVGSITGPDGEPAPEATVTFDELGLTVDTDDEGTLAQRLHPGTYAVTYSALGYQDATGTVTVREGDVTDLSLQLTAAPTGTVAGTVLSTGEIGTGAVPADQDGVALEGATVRLLGIPRAVTTGEDGSYQLPYVPAGDYQLEINHPEHLRQVHDVTVAAGETLPFDTVLRVAPLVGVLDDMRSAARPHGDVRRFLEHWGYHVTDITWDDPDALAGVDLLVANGATFGNVPSAEELAAFDDALTRSRVSTLWMGTQFGRGTIQYLHQYLGDPAEEGDGRSGGETLAVVAEGHQDHPLLAGVDLTDGTFPIVQTDRNYQWFSGYSGTTIASLTTEEEGELGDTIAVKGRTTQAVDILLSTMATSSNGRPSVPGDDSFLFTPEAEQVYLNAMGYALDAESLGGEVRGTVTADGTAVASTVTVAESGRVHPGRDGDGSFLVPLDPGTWTLEVQAYGYQPQELTVTVEAGEVEQLDIALVAGEVGAVTGTVTDHVGAPIADVTASVGDRRATTDDQGRYTLATVPSGERTVEFAKDGLRTESRTVTVETGEQVGLDVVMGEAASVALVGDRNEDMATVLRDAAYEVDTFDYPQLSVVTPVVGDYDTIVVNGFGTAPSQADYLAFLDAAEEAEVSVVFAGQYVSGTIRHLSDYTGDPVETPHASVRDVVHYTVTQEHPILAGYEVGDTIPILNREGNTVPYQSFFDYSGVTLAHLSHLETEADLGQGLAYRYTSPASVHVLLGSLAASAYGTPADPNRWTPEAYTILLNAVSWSVDASQSTITGTVTDDGEPVAGASVTAMGTGVSVTTSLDGSYRLGVPAGTHTVEVSATGYDVATDTVTVGDQETAILDVELVRQPRGTLVVDVVSARDGSPVEDATVRLEGPMTQEASTDDAGQVEVDDLLPGGYAVSVTAQGHLAGSTEATVTVGETAEVTVELLPNEVLVLGDTSAGAVTGLLVEDGLPAATGSWDEIPGSLEGQRVVVVNGGDPTAEQFAAFMDVVEEERVHAVFLGTDPVAGRGGTALLAAHGAGGLELGPQGYRAGAVRLTGFDPEHPLFAGLSDPATVLGDDGYYSTIAAYDGQLLADLHVGQDADLTGAAVAVAEQAQGHLHLVLSFLAATRYQGPGLGWTDDGETLLSNAVDWALQTEVVMELPQTPVIEVEHTLVDDPQVTVTGTAVGADVVVFEVDGDVSVEVVPEEDGSLVALLTLSEGPNEIVAAATNEGGTVRSEPFVVTVDTTPPDMVWTGPEDGLATLEDAVEVTGTVVDEHAGLESLTVDGEEVEVAEDGSFAVMAALVTGANEITVVATDALGHQSSEVRTVHRLPLTAQLVMVGQRRDPHVDLVLTAPSDGRRLAITSARLQAVDSAGEVVRDLPMSGGGWRYHAQIRGLSGRYTLQAVIVVEGHTVLVPGLEVLLG